MHNTVSTDGAKHAPHVAGLRTVNSLTNLSRWSNSRHTNTSNGSMNTGTAEWTPAKKRTWEYTVDKLMRHIGSKNNIKHGSRSDRYSAKSRTSEPQIIYPNILLCTIGLGELKLWNAGNTCSQITFGALVYLKKLFFEDALCNLSPFKAKIWRHDTHKKHLVDVHCFYDSLSVLRAWLPHMCLL